MHTGLVRTSDGLNRFETPEEEEVNTQEQREAACQLGRGLN